MSEFFIALKRGMPKTRCGERMRDGATTTRWVHKCKGIDQSVVANLAIRIIFLCWVYATQSWSQ